MKMICFISLNPSHSMRIIHGNPSPGLSQELDLTLPYFFLKHDHFNYQNYLCSILIRKYCNKKIWDLIPLFVSKEISFFCD